MELLNLIIGMKNRSNSNLSFKIIDNNFKMVLKYISDFNDDISEEMYLLNFKMILKVIFYRHIYCRG